MREVEKILERLEYCIVNNTFESIESDHCELKDNSSESSQWKQVFITTCAFLNTNPGIIILGVFEDEKKKKYILKGYDERQNEKIRKIFEQFTDETGIKIENIRDYIYVGYEDLLDKRVLTIHIDKLPEEVKYAYYNGIPYRRVLTSDEKIDSNSIAAQKERKKELENARELWPVPNTTLQSLSIEKLNSYIVALNIEKQIENPQPSIQEALAFLSRKWFITLDKQPTLLGMLVCGNHLEDYLGGRCQVDCYVEMAGTVAENKKVFKDNILPLLEKCVRFINQNIKTGVSMEDGGRRTPEYPEDIIRESVNNSIAHRDYSIDRFININIHPNKHIEIRNPGRFKKSLLKTVIRHSVQIRRIIPGNPKANNPKLADVLKVYEKWEGKGRGMSTLTTECLNNNIDVPYYKFYSEDELSLFIPKGHLLDEYSNFLIDNYSGYIKEKLNGNHISEEQKRVIIYLFKSEQLNNSDFFTINLTTSNNHLDALRSLELAKLIFRHESSDDYNTIYLVDRNLFKTDFSTELRALFGADFGLMPQERKDVLQTIYLCNNFSEDKYPNANRIGNILWFQKYSSKKGLTLEDFKRSIRKNVNALLIRKIITVIDKKVNRPLYSINKDFSKIPSLYED